MKFLGFFRAATVLGVILIASNAFGISIRSDYDTTYDLGRLRSFTFLEQRRGANDPLARNTIIANRIRDSLAQQLQAAGFQYQPQGQPDFVIAYYASAQVREEIQTIGYGFPGRWRWGFGPELWTRYFTVGTAVVDFIDPTNRQLVWRGIASDTVEEDTEDSVKQINKGAQKLVKQFAKDVRKQTKQLAEQQRRG